MTITEFLTARYDEDEAVAREVQEKVRENDRGWASYYEHAEGSAASIIWDVDYNQGGYTIAAARALADIAAKRAILQAWAARADDDHPAISAHRTGLGLAIKCLAQPYANHPDFDESWKP